MPFPKRDDFANGDAFLRALDAHAHECEMENQYVWGWFDATPAFTSIPDWVCPQNQILHIDLSAGEESKEPSQKDLEVMIRALSGCVVDKDKKVVRLCHGASGGIWSIWVEVEDRWPATDSTESVAA